jgi:hypothetical protein
LGGLSAARGDVLWPNGLEDPPPRVVVWGWRVGEVVWGWRVGEPICPNPQPYPPLIPRRGGKSIADFPPGREP